MIKITKKIIYKLTNNNVSNSSHFKVNSNYGQLFNTFNEIHHKVKSKKDSLFKTIYLKKK